MTHSYKNKLISIDDALTMIKTDDAIISALGGAEPTGILSRLHEIKDRVKNVSVATCLPMNSYDWFTKPEMKGHFSHDAWFYSPGIRKAHKEAGTCSYIPNHLHLAGSDRIGFRKPNVFVGTCTPPDRFGYISLSLSVTYERGAIEAADIVILEINENMPRTYGDTIIHVDAVDYFIDHTAKIPELPILPFSEKDSKIGQFISERIENGSTLQLGIGGIPNAVAAELIDKKDLSIHTEMFTDGMVDLYEAGVLSTVPRSFSEKILAGRMVTTFALGSKKLYDFINENPGIAFMRGDWTNDPYVIGHNYKQVSINTAIEVDLTGQVCSETIGHVQFSGTGGQSDTAIGAQMSEDGKSFIALYSTTSIKQPDGSRKAVSKIVPTLQRGAAVTLHRASVDMIVTEYGVAELKGCNVRERIQRLIAIAHPDFRAELQEGAEELGYI